MGHDDDGEVFFERLDEVFDLAGRDRVQSRSGLVHQQHFGVHGETAGDAEPLLLAAGKIDRRAIEPVLDLVPERRVPQAPFANLHQHVAVALAVNPRPVRDVLEDALWKRIGALKHHAYAMTDRHGIHGGRVDVLAVQADAAAHARVGIQIVHAVERANERGLAAAGRPDQRGHAILGYVERGVLEREKIPVPNVQVGNLEFRVRNLRRRLGPRLGGLNHGLGYESGKFQWRHARDRGGILGHGDEFGRLAGRARDGHDVGPSYGRRFNLRLRLS